MPRLRSAELTLGADPPGVVSSPLTVMGASTQPQSAGYPLDPTSRWLAGGSATNRYRLLGLLAACFAAGTGCNADAVDAPDDAGDHFETASELGASLFNDKNLSARRRQACATCHDPQRGFADAREHMDGRIRPGSLGDDGVSIGNRNAPTASYASFIPVFGEAERARHNSDGDLSRFSGYLGGLFHDGRAMSLAAQAAGPPLNPIEMGMTDEAAVAARLAENPDYVLALGRLYDVDAHTQPTATYAAVADAIASFERSELFSPFDSRYDRSLRSPGDGERYIFHPASKAAQGKALFFSAEFTNCAACHQLHAQGSAEAAREVFSSFEHHNLGVPTNHWLQELNGSAEADLGLGARLDDRDEDGKFRTPTLRNVAVTPPYMHNGVFQQLSTVLRFYEHAKRLARKLRDDTNNPETGAPWAGAEVPRNLSVDELASGNKDLYDDDHVLALECFLMSLTDAHFEPLLDPQKVKECGL